MAGGAAQLSPADQTAYLDLLVHGASPLAACRQLNISLASIAATVAECPAFLDRIRGAGDVLSQNVAAALYRAAMQGNVTAQKFFLQHRPPPEWHGDTHSQTPAQESLSPHELAAEYLAAGLDVPPELQALLGPPGVPLEP